ncbi:MAG: hypothetical protein OXU23_02985 [Candidatus Poribacteria bacterium]|nr:hypothetical protein [Candidatus Poribacteria bacterium]
MTRFKTACQLREHRLTPRQAIDDSKVEVALRRKFVVGDRIEVVGNFTRHPFITLFNENLTPDFLGKLVIAAVSENKCISVCVPKGVIGVQINGEIAERVDSAKVCGETRKNKYHRK